MLRHKIYIPATLTRLNIAAKMKAADTQNKEFRIWHYTTAMQVMTLQQVLSQDIAVSAGNVAYKKRPSSLQNSTQFASAGGHGR